MAEIKWVLVYVLILFLLGLLVYKTYSGKFKL
jgi:hypothetical protein